MKYQTLQNTVFFSFLIAVSLVFALILLPFFKPILWAIILSVVFYPLNKRIEKKIKNGAISSTITIAIILLLLFTPLYLVGSMVLKEAVDLYQNTTSYSIQTAVSNTSELLQIFGINVSKEQLLSLAQNTGKTVASVSYNLASSATKSFTTFFVQFFLMLYILFFTLKDAEKYINKIKHILPLGTQRENVLFNRIATVIRAIFKGTLAIAVLQGFVGSLFLFIAGVESVALWGAVMTILALIPALGPALVLALFAFVLFIQGNLLSALVLVFGIALVSVLDNILRPILVGKQTHIPDVFILISVLGGIYLWGISGFVLGPVFAGVFLTMWDMFEKIYKKELDND